MSGSPFGRLEYEDGRTMPGVLLATGRSNGWKPYVYRDPGASPERAALAGAILAEVGPETDVWDLPYKPSSRSIEAYLLRGCGTEAAYRRHLRDNERPCRECTDANRRIAGERRRQQRKQQALRRAS